MLKTTRVARRPDPVAQHEAAEPARSGRLRRPGRRHGAAARRDGRRILWLAHEGAPKNFTGVDVTDPRNPKMVVQTELPHMKVRSNSLDVVGNLMVVAYQTKTVGLKPAGVDIFDISTPETPKLLSHFDCSGPHSRGVHCVWFVDGKTVHMSAGAPDFQPRNPLDDQFYRVLDVSNPSKPTEKAAGGTPARARATPRRRRRACPSRSTWAFAPTTPTSTRSGRTAPTSATSTAA
jgi:hypothetical protein